MIVDDNGMCLLDDEDMSYHTNTVVGAVTPIKQTNGDRIRAMTDEELAKYIIVMAKDDYCDRKNCTGRPCWRCRLEWLEKEAKDV